VDGNRVGCKNLPIKEEVQPRVSGVRNGQTDQILPVICKNAVEGRGDCATLSEVSK